MAGGKKRGGQPKPNRSMQQPSPAADIWDIALDNNAVARIMEQAGFNAAAVAEDTEEFLDLSGAEDHSDEGESHIDILNFIRRSPQVLAGIRADVQRCNPCPQRQEALQALQWLAADVTRPVMQRHSRNRFQAGSGRHRRTAAPAQAVDASKLVAQLKDSSDGTQQLGLLQQVINVAKASNDERVKFLTGGVISVLLRLLQSSSTAVQEAAQGAITQLVFSTAGNTEAAILTSAIPQLVPLVRSRNQDIQFLALQMLVHLSDVSGDLTEAIAAAGAVPAVMEALHNGREQIRLKAAVLLVQLAGQGGMYIDTALAGAVPVAVSALQCGPEDSQVQAARALRGWASKISQVSALAVSLDAIPPLLSIIQTPQSPTQQQAAANLLAVLASDAQAAQAAVDKGTVPALVQLLCDARQRVCHTGADTLMCILARCSQAASIAASAGAIPPLVKMLATSSSSINSAGNNSGRDEGDLVGGMCALTAPAANKEWQMMAICSLQCIAGKGDAQCRSSIVEAGGTAAICAAAHSQEQAIRLFAGSTLQHLMKEASNWSEMVAHLITLLTSSTHADVQARALVAIFKMYCEDASIRPAMIAVGVIPAVVAALRQQLSPDNTVMAIDLLTFLAQDDDHADAMLEAGAVSVLLQLLQPSSDKRLSEAAARLLHVLGVLPPEAA